MAPIQNRGAGRLRSSSHAIGTVSKGAVAHDWEDDPVWLDRNAHW